MTICNYVEAWARIFKPCSSGLWPHLRVAILATHQLPCVSYAVPRGNEVTQVLETTWYFATYIEGPRGTGYLRRQLVTHVFRGGGHEVDAHYLKWEVNSGPPTTLYHGDSWDRVQQIWTEELDASDTFYAILPRVPYLMRKLDKVESLMEQVL